MGFLKKLRSKTRINARDTPSNSFSDNDRSPTAAVAAYYGPDHTARLPANVLTKILIQVCPHTQDDSYLPCERVSLGDGCMLCDLRDLGSSAQVSRKWYGLAQDLL